MKPEKILIEAMILAVLFIVIIVLLVIALYEYQPNMSIASVESYTRKEGTSQVLQEIATTDISNTDSSIIKSYTISSKDLNVYAQSEIYEASRPNPFAKVEDDANYKANNSNTDNVGSENINGTTNSTGYFNKTGTNK